MQIGETYSWVPTSWEGSNGIVSALGKKGGVHGRIVYIKKTIGILRRRRTSAAWSSARASNFKEGTDMLSYKTKDGKVTELEATGGTIRNDRRGRILDSRYLQHDRKKR